jgi:prefoldin subunit 5
MSEAKEAALKLEAAESLRKRWEQLATALEESKRKNAVIRKETDTLVKENNVYTSQIEALRSKNGMLREKIKDTEEALKISFSSQERMRETFAEYSQIFQDLGTSLDRATAVTARGNVGAF